MRLNFSKFGRLGSTTALVSSGPPPTNLAISADTIAESAVPMTVVGTLTCDAPGDIVTWSMVDDAGGRFRIWGGKRDQIALTWVHLDRVVATSYNITVRATGLLGTATQTFAISVTDVVDPGEVTTTPLIAGHFQSGVTLSGSNITALAAAWSATGGGLTGASGAEPDLVSAGGPAGQNYALFNSGENFTFSATSALSNFDLYFVFSFDNLNDLYLVGNTTNAENFIRLQANGSSTGLTRLQVDWGTVGTATTNLTFTTELTPGNIYLLRLSYAAAGGANNVKCYVNNVGTVNVQGTKATETLTIAKIGKAHNVSTTSVWRLFAFACYGAVNSADDATAIADYLWRWRAHRHFVSTSGSDASTTPWVVSAPVATPTRALHPYFYHGDAIILADDEEWRNTGLSVNVIGSSTKRMYIGASDPYTATPPRFYGGEDLSGATWVNTTGDEWTTAVAEDPALVFYEIGTDYTVASNVQRLDPDPTLAAAWTFTWAAGTLTIRVSPSFDPNGKTFNATSTSSTGIAGTLSHIVFGGMSIRYWGGVGLRLAGTGGDAVDIETSCNANDGQDAFGTGTVINFYRSRSYFNGPASGAGGAGDAISYHGTAGGLVWAADLRHNTCGGVRNLQGPQVTIDASYIEGNGYDVLQLQSGATDNGYLYLYNSVVRVTSASQSGNGYEAEGALEAGWSGEVYNCTIDQRVAGTGNGIMAESNDGVDVQNTIVTNFSVALQKAALGVLTEDYNILYNNTTARSAGISTGANTITTDPGFTDAANGDYTLTANIAGAALAESAFDQVNRERAGTPSRGALEFA